MSKGKTKKEIAKKNPLLEDEEVVSAPEVEEEVVEEVADEVEEEVVEEAPKAKKAKKAQDAPVKVDVAQEAQSDIRTTKEKLAAQEQIKFMIPLSEGEKPGATHPVFINGYQFDVPKGVMTLIPRDVAELLAESFKIGMYAGADFRVDLNAQKQDALS